MKTTELNQQEQLLTNGGACVMLDPGVPPEENTAMPSNDGATYDPNQPTPQETVSYMRASDGPGF